MEVKGLAGSVVEPFAWGVQQLQRILDVVAVVADVGASCLLVPPVAEVQAGLVLLGHGVLPAAPEAACREVVLARGGVRDTSRACGVEQEE